jgi:hypothetical protein
MTDGLKAKRIMGKLKPLIAQKKWPGRASQVAWVKNEYRNEK